tara:strand:+ start:843 stop:1361 length:519 start_codon:yes stop_codon:yes gene_type:complete
MIIYTGNKGKYLIEEIESQGYKMENRDGIVLSSNDVAVQAIIDSFDPLPEAKKEQIDLVNKTAGESRTKYVTNIPFQEAAYQAKEADVRRYKAAGYPVDLTLYPFTAAEANATGTSAQDAADSVILQADQWVMVSAEIERLRRKASVEIELETDWQNVEVIAKNYIQLLEMI